MNGGFFSRIYISVLLIGSDFYDSTIFVDLPKPVPAASITQLTKA